MIRLTPTKKPEAVMMFIRGDGLLKKCAGGADVDRELLNKWIEESPAIFLVASEDGTRGLGFVCLNPEKNGAYSMHLCLRTKGDKTKKIIALAVNYARMILGATQIDAVYPASHRAVKRLCDFFGFKDDSRLMGFYKVPDGPPFAFKSLQIA